MTKEYRSPNDESRSRDLHAASRFVIRHLSLIRHSVIRHSSFFLLLLPLTLHATDNVGVLGSKPKWDVLENYQRTLTHDEFVHLINDTYCTHGFAPDLIKIDNDAAQILTNRESHHVFTLHFATDANSKAHIPRLWRPAKSLPPARASKPLAGLRVALDPGHLGGKWAKMEERWFQVGDAKPVTEGDMTLRVSRLLATRLRK